MQGLSMVSPSCWPVTKPSWYLLRLGNFTLMVINNKHINKAEQHKQVVPEEVTVFRNKQPRLQFKPVIMLAGGTSEEPIEEDFPCDEPVVNRGLFLKNHTEEPPCTQVLWLADRFDFCHLFKLLNWLSTALQRKKTNETNISSKAFLCVLCLHLTAVTTRLFQFRSGCLTPSHIRINHMPATKDTVL